MLLRIIDVPALGNDDDALRIVLENGADTQQFATECYDSPITSNFRKTLGWYFNDYPQNLNNSADQGVVDKVIKLGKQIGEELLGEDHQLIKIIEQIEAAGYRSLNVQLESARIGFFSQWWETTVLPQSKYVLSSAVKGFTRQFTQDDCVRDYPELNFGLKVELKTQDHLAELMGNDSPAATPDSPKKPLRILYLVSRVGDLACTSSNSINLSFNASNTGGVIDYDIHQAIDWKQLCNRLSDKQNPVHVFHYDGPVILENSVANIVLDDGSESGALVSIDELSKILVSNKVAVLSIDARVYLDNGQSLCATKGLATIAQSAHQQGLGNVIGLAQTTNPWTSGQLFEALYGKIVNGLSLNQAVVESRKALRSATESALVTVKPVVFHPWPLLVHYSQQSVTFFDANQSPVDSNAAQETASGQDKLFGFKNQLLPPLLNVVCDTQILPILASLEITQQALSLTGVAGSGKTQLAHVVSLHLAQKQVIDFGFYFDFSHDHYTAKDMLDMIAPVLGLKIVDEVEEKLATQHCCFVIDGAFDNNQSATDKKALQLFLQKQLSNGHKVIVTGDVGLTIQNLNTVEITTSPLSPLEQKVLAANRLRQLGLTDVEQDKHFEALLSTLNGHPWLTKKLMGLLPTTDAAQLTEQVTQHILSQQGSVVEAFYQWQWSTLRPVWQKLLLLCSDVPGLLLEMLMIAADQQQSTIATQSLFALLGQNDVKFADGLDKMAAAGFLSRFPHGHLVDTRSLSFLAKQRENAFEGIDSQQLKLNFSQLICDGIKKLVPNVVKQQNANISSNLLVNRRHWVKHFEDLWFGQDFRGFIEVKNAFDSLLQQAKLGEESQLWSLDLIGRSPVMTTDDDTAMDAKLCWLAVAVSGLSQMKDSQSIANCDALVKSAQNWQQWFETVDVSVDESLLALFSQAATFLELFYQSQSQWQAAIVITQKAEQIYSQYTAWQRAIGALKSQAKYHHELGETEQGLSCEDKVIHDIPYDGAPKGYYTQQLLDILMVRLARGYTLQAQSLLDQIREDEGTQNIAEMLDGLQCDIYYQTENYLAALPYYCKTWGKALQSNQPVQLEPLKARLMALEQKLGQSCFDTHFEQIVPEGTVKPQAYVIV